MSLRFDGCLSDENTCVVKADNSQKTIQLSFKTPLDFPSNVTKVGIKIVGKLGMFSTTLLDKVVENSSLQSETSYNLNVEIEVKSDYAGYSFTLIFKLYDVTNKNADLVCASANMKTVS